MSNKSILYTTVMSLCFFCGCGSSGGGDANTAPPPASTTVMVKTYYDAPANTMVQEEGLVLVGADGQPTNIKQGLWKSYFPPADGNSINTEKIYANGTWDENQVWTEFNADSSIRNTMVDVIY